MNKSTGPKILTHTTRILAVASLLILICTSQVLFAQSGRRVRRSETPPPQPEVVEPQPEVKPTPKKPVPTASVIIGGDKMADMNLSFYVDRAVQACVSELRTATSITADAGGNMTRKDAIDQAKSQKESFIALIEISVESNGTTQPDIAFRYVVFAPETGKVKTTGTVYVDPNAVGAGQIGVRLPRTGTMARTDYIVDQGGRMVAHRLAQVLYSTKPAIPDRK